MSHNVIFCPFLYLFYTCRQLKPISVYQNICVKANFSANVNIISQLLLIFKIKIIFFVINSVFYLYFLLFVL